MTVNPNIAADMANIALQKRALRETVLAKRAALAVGDRSAATRVITARLLSHPAYAKARSVLAYASFGDEMDTSALLEHVLQSGKSLVLPRVDKRLHQLALHKVNSLVELVSGIWGIREPSADAPRAILSDVDFVLVPGVAFDRRGQRLGYGGGFYDRLLATPLPETQALTRLSTVFSCQIVDAVPISAHDVGIPIIITENEVINAHDC